jgi:thiaminase/transcriptional activator TenA
MTAARYGRAFALWRAAAGEAWRGYTRHAFVEGLRTGDLPRERYLGYLRQDYVFLIHYARAWSLAAAKSGDLAEMRAASAAAHALIHVEMPLHVESCARHGIDLAALEATAEAAENLAYTRYVMEAGYSGDLLDLLAALAPCVLGYGEIGLRLKGSGGPYAEWCDVYGGDAYQALCHEVGALLDDALERRLGPGWAELPRAAALAHRFATATRLEIGFWNMALAGARAA